jgi:hypothetical protein
MTLTLELPRELESRLAREAGRRGLPVASTILEILDGAIPEEGIGAQIVREWERAGVIGSRPDILDSQEHALRLREQAQTRTWE